MISERAKEIEAAWKHSWEDCPTALKAEHYLLTVGDVRDHCSELYYLRELVGLVNIQREQIKELERDSDFLVEREDGSCDDC